MNRIDERINNPAIYYDSDAIDGFIKFCENELTIVDGSALYLTDSFKLWLEDLFSWYYFIDRSVFVPDPDYRGGHYEVRQIKQRLINKQILIVGRGAAKTIYDEIIHAYGLVLDTQTTKQVTVAPTMAQANEVLDPLKTAITKARGPLLQFLTEGSIFNTTGNRAKRQKLCSTKKGIENLLTNSLLEIRPMSIDKLQGLRTKYVTVDEWLSGDCREDVIGALEQGASKQKDYILVATSSEGTVRNGVGDTIKMELMDILKGEYPAPHVSIWWYKLDDISEVGKPNLWIKANPNLGITVTYETYQQDVIKAEKVPAARNDILAKRFGLPMEGYAYFFTYEETLPHRKQEFWGMPCSLGADLSQGDDFCAFTFIFPLRDGVFGVKVRSYITSNVRTFGYDPYNAKEFVDRWCQEYGPYGVEKVIQGVKTESVPLGELKTLAEDRSLIFDESLMQYAMGNSITIEDTNGNRKLLKKRYEAKIDNVSAMMDAFVAYKRGIMFFD